MAKVNMGILDGFNGKVGTVVGYDRFNKNWMRAYTSRVKNPRSGAQVLVRARFRLLNSVGTAFLAALQVGMANTARSQANTPSNAFMRRNWEHTSGTTPAEVAVALSSLTVSEGQLPKPGFALPSFDESLLVKVSYTGHTDQPLADADDLVYLFAYQADTNSGVLGTPAKRSAGSASVAVPSDWSGMEVHVYAFAVGGGKENKGLCSNSAYLGTGTIG